MNQRPYDENMYELSDQEIQYLVENKHIYLKSLIESLSDLIACNGSLATGIFENIKDIIIESKVSPVNKSDEFHVMLSQRKDIFID